MNKAVAAIAAMGFAGCLLLGIGMQQLADHNGTRKRETPEQVVARKFGPRLAGPLQLREEHEGTCHRLVASVRLSAGAECGTLAAEIAAELQPLVAGARPGEGRPVELVVEVHSQSAQLVQQVAVPIRAPNPAPVR